jgi:hypothetical protein
MTVEPFEGELLVQRPNAAMSLLRAVLATPALAACLYIASIEDGIHRADTFVGRHPINRFATLAAIPFL